MAKINEPELPEWKKKMIEQYRGWLEEQGKLVIAHQYKGNPYRDRTC